MKLILGSKSPRRREILSMVGIDFEVVTKNVDEKVVAKDPKEKVKKIAMKKCNAIFDDYPDNVVLCADTIVLTEKGEVLEKPKDIDDARRMIEDISGTYHYVYTAFIIKSKDKEITHLEETKVFVTKMSKYEIEEYIHTTEPYDKAGAYAIQGLFGKYIEKIEGDYYNVMGLPINKVYECLKEF